MPSEPLPSAPVAEVLDRAAAVHRSRVLRGLANRARLLWQIADELEMRGDDVVAVAAAETHLTEARLNGELLRTVGQLRGFAAVIGSGTWSGLVIDTGPPDLRRATVPLGPVAVFGAANFPLAFSTAGGDTASALAAGCPVVLKAHPDHPETSAVVAGAVDEALRRLDLPAGVFQHLAGGNEVGAALVADPATQAVAFTGSFTAGQALRQVALERAQPIPFFAEMGSQNPVFVLPAAWATRAAAIVAALADSVTSGVGQFCTNPGVIAAPATIAPQLAAALGDALAATPAGTMLSPTIADRFSERVTEIAALGQVHVVAGGPAPGTAGCVLVSATDFAATAELHDEVFGPFTIVVSCTDVDELVDLADWFEGQLTATIHAEDADGALAERLLDVLVDRVGRVIWNGVPTGVTVSAAMHHGGPFPASFDGRATSVGSAAIERFLRPVTFQDVPDARLPPELQDANPFNLERRLDGRLTTAAVERR